MFLPFVVHRTLGSRDPRAPNTPGDRYCIFGGHMVVLPSVQQLGRCWSIIAISTVQGLKADHQSAKAANQEHSSPGASQHPGAGSQQAASGQQPAAQEHQSAEAENQEHSCVLFVEGCVV